MQVFISWSGKQSNTVAVALRDWLPQVLARKVTAFVSSEDIDRGARGLNKIADELEESQFGIVVVTRTNVGSTWINFEAGALGKSVTDGRVAPLLVGLADADLDGPLKQFQNTAATDRDAVFALVTSVNNANVDRVDPDTVRTLFDVHWDEFEAAVERAMLLHTAPPPKRSPDDLLEEVLTTIRALQREVADLRGAPSQSERERVRRWMDSMGYDEKVWSPTKSPNVERLRRILGTSGAGAKISASLETADVYLGGPPKPISQEKLTDMQALATNQQLTITIYLVDGERIIFSPDGTRTRLHPDDIDPIG
ncbi:toll/interleukin-1 receptor domain-containing protein [Homoserinibacter sp. GY 40078]|uniref:toll/interleukin-1 receptor domain-containing protein n=1 Tax=Homoserinibacter sp. GY 40078 TaxID=2603275 RepID=UPI00165018C9|nr:TIR domain-containing protein [Homoserinibacter sp. GY 40078]